MQEKDDRITAGHAGCLICAKPIVYYANARRFACEICAAVFEANAACEDGHYICDKCHASGLGDVMDLLRRSCEKDPIKLFLMVAALDHVHLHGPEHHSIVPCVLLAAHRNNGGEIDLGKALETAFKRGAQVPGGVCGFWGACGAAIGAGIYASVVTGSNPLDAAWDIPQRLTARCLERIAAVGGPRCCKRTSRLAIECAADFAKEYFGVAMPRGNFPCAHHRQNEQCLRKRCPYYQIDDA